MPKALQTIEHEPEIYTRDGIVLTDSVRVSRFFGKRHDHVIEAIDNAHVSDAFRAENFLEIETIEKSGATTRKRRVVEMRFSGFIRLIMSFTGREAGILKEAYILRFEAMERELAERNAAPPRAGLVDLNDLASVQVALLALVGDKQRLLAEVSETKGQLAVVAPKAASWDAYANADGLIALSDVGRILDVGARKIVDFLLAQKILFRSGRGSPLRPIDVYRRKGWFRVITTPINGVERMQTFATPRGLQEIATLLGRPLDMFGQVDKQARLPLLKN